MKSEDQINKISDDLLLSKILFMRDERVLLDRDLAILYGVKPIRLREQVKRNVNRFPIHFMFQLTEQEVEILVSQNAIPSRKHLGGHLPFAFTEHGILMLANVLKSEQAIQVSIRLIELFVKLRRLYLTNAEILLEMENIKKRVNNQEKNIELVFSYFDEMLQKQSKTKPIRKIGFKIPKH
jgi:phage regulator Rha-like protein